MVAPCSLWGWRLCFDCGESQCICGFPKIRVPFRAIIRGLYWGPLILAMGASWFASSLVIPKVSFLQGCEKEKDALNPPPPKSSRGPGKQLPRVTQGDRMLAIDRFLESGALVRQAGFPKLRSTCWEVPMIM